MVVDYCARLAGDGAAASVALGRARRLPVLERKQVPGAMRAAMEDHNAEVRRHS